MGHYSLQISIFIRTLENLNTTPFGFLQAFDRYLFNLFIEFLLRINEKTVQACNKNALIEQYIVIKLIPV